MLDVDSLRPYLKALAPAAIALIGAVVYGLITDHWDKPQLEVLAVGFASAGVTFVLTGNAAKVLGPALLTAIGIGVHYLITGEWNAAETVGGLTGLMSALVALVVPNAGIVVVHRTRRLATQAETT